jgi:hypothetical protein
MRAALMTLPLYRSQSESARRIAAAAGNAIQADIGKPLDNFGRVYDPDHLRYEPADDPVRRAGAREHGRNGVGLEFLYSHFRSGWNMTAMRGNVDRRLGVGCRPLPSGKAAVQTTQRVNVRNELNTGHSPLQYSQAALADNRSFVAS